MYMKLKFIFVCFTILFLFSSCFLVDVAEFTGTGGSIADNSTQTFTAIQTGEGDVFSMDSVTITGLTHDYAADLTITLTDPEGTSCYLVKNDGINYDFVGDYTFISSDDSDAPSLYDYNGTAVYLNGDIIEQTLKARTELQDLTPGTMAGIWTLSVTDNRTGDTGTFTSFTISLTFFKPWF